MRVLLASLKGGEGFTGKDTVAGGYGSRLRPFSLLGAAYTRFYMRPSYLATYLRVGRAPVAALVRRLDGRVRNHHAREERALMSRTVTC